jgi:hypothetical protein
VHGLKIKTARPGWLFLVACGLACGWVPHAHAADPRVLLLSPESPPRGLFAALQIQLVGLAEPELVLQARAASTAAQIDAAAALARREHALAALWVERPTQRADGWRQVILYVVGEREGRALIEIVRVPGNRGPELDRTLALKVREIVSELRRSRTDAPPEGLLLPPPPPTAAPPATPSPEEAPQPAAAEDGDPAESSAASRIGGLAQFGVRLGSQPLVGLGRWGIGLAVGPTLTLPTLRFAATAGLDWFPETSAERQGQRAEYSELAGAIGLHAQTRAGRLWFGAQTGPQLLWVQALGTTAFGLDGDPKTTVLWAWNTGLVAELPIDADVGLAAELQLQTLLRPQGFSVNGQKLVDFGSARLRLGVALTFRP